MKLLKKIIFFAVATLLVFSACKDDSLTYTEELKIEQKKIKDFIAREGIKVVTVMPTTFPWEEKVFYKSKTGLYFRLISQGDFEEKGDSIIRGDFVSPRYIQYTLDVKADTTSFESTINYPYTRDFKYLDLTQVCPAWHEAVGYMKYNNAKAQLIIPSKIGFPQFSRPATPIGYNIDIKVKKF